MPEKINLKEEMFILTYSFRRPGLWTGGFTAVRPVEVETLRQRSRAVKGEPEKQQPGTPSVPEVVPLGSTPFE